MLHHSLLRSLSTDSALLQIHSCPPFLHAYQYSHCVTGSLSSHSAAFHIHSHAHFTHSRSFSTHVAVYRLSHTPDTLTRSLICMCVCISYVAVWIENALAHHQSTTPHCEDQKSRRRRKGCLYTRVFSRKRTRIRTAPQQKDCFDLRESSQEHRNIKTL